MFPSLSRCKPSSVVTTSFVAKNDLVLNISEGITIKINGSVRAGRPISVRKNENVSATTSSSASWSGTRKISYVINGDQLSFVVANENRSSINFTLEGLANRWYRYDVEDNHFISYYNYQSVNKIKSLGFNDIPFAVDIGQNFKDFGPNNFIIRSPAGLKKKRPQDAGSHYDEVFFDNDYLTIDASEEFSLNGGQFTIDLRVKPVEINASTKYLVGTLTRNEDSISGWAITLRNGQINFLVGDSLEIASQNILSINEWNHIAVTRDTGSTKIWINGVLSAESDQNFNDSFIGSMKIATSEDNTIFPRIGNKLYNFKGALSCFRIIKSESIYKSQFEVPEPVLSLTPNTVLLTIQEDPGTIYLINVIPDPKTKTVYFYNQFGHLLDNIKLPSEPCQVEKFISEDGGYFIVSCRNKRLYKITLDKRIINKDYLLSNDGKILEWIFQLPFETDVAFIGSFSTFAKLKNKQINIGQPNSISMSNGKTWVGGYNKLWQIDKYFKIIQDFDISGTIVGLTSLGDKCAAVIRNETSGTLDLTIFDTSGISASIHSSRWMSEPLLFNGHIYVTDSTKRALIKVNPEDSTKEIIELGNNTPSYMSSNSSSIFIACHDNNKVLIFSGNINELQEVYFPEKVTWVSALEDSFMVSHYLKDTQVLAHDKPSIIYEPSKQITCEKSMASIQPFKIKNLGISSYTISPSSNFTYWVDGVPNSTIRHGSYFSISKDLTRTGYHQENIIIGDTVVDYMAHVEEPTFYPKEVLFDPIHLSTTNDLIEISFQYKHEFIEGYNAAYKSSCCASINYGFLKKNFSPYVGESRIFDGDIVTVCIPFGLSIPNAVVTLNLGAREILIPVNNQLTLTEVKSFLNVRRTSRVNHTFTITQAGKYFIPYFKNQVSPNLRQQDVDFADYALENVGGNFSVDFPLDNLLAGQEAFVPAENGLFDLYIDVDYPIIAESISLLINYEHDTIEIIDESNPTDEDGNINYVQKQLYRKTPVNFDIAASNDEINWTTVASFSNISTEPRNWVPGEYKEFKFTNDAVYRYWRLKNRTTQELGVALNGVKLSAKFPSLFSIKKNGTNLSPGLVNLSANDNISIEISSNDRLYDALRYFIAGPDNYELVVKTKSNPTIDYIEFNEINEPTLREEYISEQITIATDIAAPINLYSTDPLLLISKNDGDYAQSFEVIQNDTIRLKKTIRNVFDSISRIYDRQEDEVTGEFINVDVISIVTRNIILSGPEKHAAGVFRISKLNKIAGQNSFLRATEVISHENNLYNPLMSLTKFQAVENFVSDIKFNGGFSAAPSYLKYQLAAKFNKISTSAKLLLADDVRGYDTTANNYSTAQRFILENTSNNYWAIEDFEFITRAVNELESIPFEFIRRALNAFVSIPSGFDHNVQQPFIIDKFITEYIQANFNYTPISFSFAKLLETYLLASSHSYLRTSTNHIDVLVHVYFAALNHPLSFIRFNYLNVSAHLLKSLTFEYLNSKNHTLDILRHMYDNDNVHFLLSAGNPYIALLNSFFLSRVIYDDNFSNPLLLQNYQIIPPLAGNLLFVAATYENDLNSINLLETFTYQKNIQKIIFQEATYDFNRIKALPVNYLQNIVPLEANYLYVKINYVPNKDFLFIFEENGFYGFFDSENDAAIEARRKKHTPFKVYAIPQSTKWTYRREYQFIDGCSIEGGRIKRLVQGG